MTLPDRYLRDHPAIPGSDNLYDISHWNDALAVGGWANRVVAARAELMAPEQAMYYNAWAKAHPTVNPRVWAPLAQHLVDPYSDLGMSVAQDDIKTQVANGTYGVFPGSKQGGKDPAPPPDPDATTTDDGGGGFWGGVLGFGAAAAHAVGTGISTSASVVANGPTTLIRAGETVLSAPYQAMTAIERTSLGNNAKLEKAKERIAERNGLTKDDLNAAEAFFSGGGNLGSVQVTPGQYIDPTAAAQGQASDSTEATKERFYAQFGSDGNVDAKWNAYQQFLAAQKRIAGEPSDYAKSVALQTDLGVVARSFRDGVKGNYLQNRPEDGSVFDPKTGKWVVQNDDGTVRDAQWVDHGGLFVPSEAKVETEAEAIRAYDMRTPEERKNGIAPYAWTLGRGIAHRWYSPDQTAFGVMSGVVDFNSSLFTDPVNLIPVGALGHVGGSLAAALGSRSARAFEAYGDNVVVAVRSQRMAGNKILRSPLEGAPTGSRLAVPDAVASGADVILDPQLAMRGYFIDGTKVVKQSTEGGLVPIPHGKYVARDSALAYLTNGKGQRAVDALADMTNPVEIYLRSNRRFDADLALQLADATTPEEVRAVLAPRIGVTLEDPASMRGFYGQSPMLSKVPGIGPGFAKGISVPGAALEGSGLFTSKGRSALARNFANYGALAAGRSLYRTPFRLAPSSGVGFDADDLDSVMDEMERFFRGTRIPDSQWMPMAEDLMRSRNGIQRYNAIYDAENGVLAQVNKTLTDEFGINPDYAKRLTRAFDSGLDDAKRIWVNKDLESASYGAQADGRIGRALLLNEMLSSRIFLPDYRSLRRATGAIAKVEKVLPDGLEKTAYVSNMMTGFTSVWRDLVLMRPAYIFRELGELAFSSSLAGGKGAFTHPYGFIATAMQSTLAYQMHTLAGKVMTSPIRGAYGGLRTGVDSASRFLVTQGDERKAWVAAASLPDHRRPDILKGKTPEEAGRLYDEATPSQRGELFWNSVDKKALQDYLLTHEGAQWFFPGLRGEWARINGKKMFEELQQMMEGKDVTPAKFQYETNLVAGNMVIDEPAVRGAARAVRTLGRDDQVLRREYINALIDSKLAPMAKDSLMRKLAAPDADTAQILDKWRGGSDWALRREMQPNLWGKDKFPDKQLSDITVGEDLDFLMGHSGMLAKVTGSDRKLLDAIVADNFEGGAIDSRNTALHDYIGSRMDDDAWRQQLPPVLSDVPPQLGLRGRYQRAVNDFFKMTGDLSDVFGRSPLLRHFYTDYVVSHAKYFSAEARAQAVRNLREAGDYKLAKRVLSADRPQRGVGTLGVEEMEMAASGYARKMVGKSFYNAHHRQNYALALRIVTPFIQATLNTFKRWAVMSLQNPQMAYRTLKPIQALTEPGSAVIYDVLGAATGDEAMQGLYTPGHPEASVDGFFFHNSYGDRVFAFPAVRQVYNLLAGEYNPIMKKDIPEGSLALSNAGNLNVAGVTVNPGMGPLVTLPASLMTGDKIYQDNFGGEFLRAMFPYGLPQGNALRKAMDSVLPTAFKKVLLSPEQQANFAAKLMPTLAATGDYDLTQPSEKRRLIADANEMAGAMNTFAGVWGMATPTTFNWNYALKVTDNDKHGAVRFWMMQDRLAQEFSNYTAPKSDATYQEDYDSGAIQFLKDYGIYALYSVMPRTEMPGKTVSISPTADVWSFRSEHPDLYDKYTGVIGLFFPGGDPASEFGQAEQNLYRWQTATGERTYKTPDDFWNDANISIGWLLYSNQAKDVMEQVPDPTQQTPILARLADDISDKFPGWTRDPVDPAKFKIGIQELEEASHDPDMQTLPGTPYIARYLDARDDAIDELRDLGYAGTLNASYAAAQRARLASLATKLVVQDTSGTFAYTWTRFLGGELESEG